MLKFLLGLIEIALGLGLLGLAIGDIGRFLAQPRGQGGTLRIGQMQIALGLFESSRQLRDAIGLALLG